MRLLLDSHVVVWAGLEQHKLSVTARRVISDSSNQLVCSVATFWELSIKEAMGRLLLKVSIDELASSIGLDLLPVTAAHVRGVRSLPLHHRDPFDRMLAAQAVAEDLTLVTADPILRRYPVRTLW